VPTIATAVGTLRIARLTAFRQIGQNGLTEK
jgi:hypothetical protein